MGKSAQSVGHRAKAAVRDACEAGVCLTQGQAASTIARGTTELVVEAMYVSMTYAAVAVSGEVAEPVVPEASGSPVDELPAVEPPSATKDAAAPAGYAASLSFVSFEASYVSDSVALELLR
ncbi:hypothetical protein [Mameliella sediminis]|uniref:hypothetical protein n=1 Tax=Mameliella sediminis TaxID=2836866 RepID=UPI001C476E35|nr:hypothetical protein [Mameliella sediminis]MBV7395569.1 hypothetical protein [Mameliella sediminis]